MRIALFLPHVGVFGGVRRYLELGNEWVALGHEVSLYHPEGSPPAWLPFRGTTAPLSSAADHAADLAICGERDTYAEFRRHHATRHLYYCVVESDPGVIAPLRDPAVTLMANSGPLRRALQRRSRRPILDGVGGIRPEQFHPDLARRRTTPLRVLVNGRRSRRRKGTDLVLRALHGLAGGGNGVEIVLFDSVDRATNRQDPRDGAPLLPNTRFVIDPTQAELVELYQSSHIFVAAEKRAGWCNTALEALACGCTLVCTRSGTTDFAHHGENALVSFRNPWSLRNAIRRLLTDDPLRERLAVAGPPSAARWAWALLARRILGQLAV
jgi:glycosyltransferase involved in cell wall biosynthesis